MTLKRLVASLFCGAVASTNVAAQEFSMPAPAPEVASPFAFVESGGKEKRQKEVAEVDSGARVIGGEVAAQGAWPWQVALVLNGRPISAEAQFCGGTIVLDTWVLTAAHCIHMQDANGIYRDLNPAAISIVVGTNELSPGKGDVVPVSAIFRHPRYNGDEFDNDIALIRLSRAPRSNYRTITVPDAEFGDLLDQPGVRTVVTGWGLTEGAQRTHLMRQAEIEMLDRDVCNQQMLEVRAQAAAQAIGLAAQVFGLNQSETERVWSELISHVREPLSENMLCSGTYEGGKTSCNGDSGGPLVVPLGDGQFIQAGVVSWGMSDSSTQSCSETAFFSAYTRVSNYVDWLNQTINSN